MKKVFKILLTIILSIIYIESVNAGSAKLNVSSSSSQVIVGNDVTVTVTVSSSSALGSWEYTLNYDKNVFKLTSSGVGLHYAGYASNASTKSVSYKYTFKALKSGSGKFYVDSSAVIGWDESIFSASNGSKTVKAISYAEYQASLSKNNNLKSLTVNDNHVTPEFQSDLTEYTITVNEDVTSIKIDAQKEDSTATINGTGTFDVEAGSNPFEIVVVAQNGSEKTYKVVVEVLDKNPIIVNVDDKEYNVVKLAKNLTKPESYEETTTSISGLDVPTFYSEITQFTLVGLKDSSGIINLYIYDNGKYTKYNELSFGSVTIYPLNMDESLYGYTFKKININGIDVEALNYKQDRFYIIKGLNVETKEEGLYLYDSKDSSLIKYNDDFQNDLIKTNKILIIVICIFGIITIALFIIMLCLLKKKKKVVKKVTLKEKNDGEKPQKKSKELAKEI